jgi:hypothetical protein
LELGINDFVQKSMCRNLELGTWNQRLRTDACAVSIEKLTTLELGTLEFET